MPIPKLHQIESWSISRYSAYSQCPALAKFKFIDKLQEPGGPALDKGNLVHALAQMYVTGKLPPRNRDNERYYEKLVLAARSITTLPDCLARFPEEFEHLRKVKAQAEESWCFDRGWNVRPWNDWAGVWLRMKVDANYLEVSREGRKRITRCVVVDYKTGREYAEDHKLQRSLYALGAFLKYPDVASATAEHWYLDAGKMERDTWLRANEDELKSFWLSKTTALLSDTTFAPRPGPKCQYCHFRKANSGPCEY